MGNLIPSFQSIANADYISLMLLGFVNHKEDLEGKREEARLYREDGVGVVQETERN